MTNNTIPNVPRELLERLSGLIGQASRYSGDSEAYAAADLNALLSAPSPAVVDGLDVVAWLCEWMGDKCGGVHSGLSKTSLEGLRRSQGEDVLIVSDEPLCRLSGAQAIIDALRGEIDQQAQRIGELEGLLRESYSFLPSAFTDLLYRIDAALSAGKEAG